MKNTAIGYGAVILTLGLMFGELSSSSAERDEDLIPPEVLRQMHPEILSRKRPQIATIRQSDIFSLRETPKLDADLVTFDFYVFELSSVQIEILRNWIKAGHNKVLLTDRYIRWFSGILGFKSEDVSTTSVYAKPRTLLSHPVNTDCRNVDFKQVNSNASITIIANLPREATVLAECDKGKAVCGSFAYGEGTVFFMNTPVGPDSRRWALNFWHWALGLPVPGARGGGRITGAGLADSEKVDSVTLKNGDIITGVIQNNSFAIRASYATLSFDIDKIASITIEGGSSNLDVLMLRVGDKISGVLEAPKIGIRLLSGGDTEIDKDKIKEIRMRKR